MVDLDYRELSPDGQDFEQLVRELALVQGFHVRWSGVGPDGGRDLLIDEPGHPAFGRKVRRWLVSAKDFSRAKKGRGRAVRPSDLDAGVSLMDRLTEHSADAFLLACSTEASTALMTHLERLESKRRVPMLVWDGVALTRMLTTPRGWAIAQRFMPKSAKSSGWQIFATTEPNMAVGVTRGMYMHIEERDRSTLDIQLERIDARLDRMQSLELPDTHELRPRRLMHDSRNNYLDIHYDLLWESHEPDSSQLDSICDRLGHIETGSYDDEVFDSVTIAARKVDRDSVEFDPDHYRYYGNGSDRSYPTTRSADDPWGLGHSDPEA